MPGSHLSRREIDSKTAGEIKRHFDIVAEGLRSEIRTVAESVAAMNERLDRLEGRIEQEFTQMTWPNAQLRSF